MVGVCLGAIGLWLGSLGTEALQGIEYGKETLGIVCCIAVPVLAIVAGRGPRRSKDAE